jgi:hypothetical protein
MDHSIRSLNYAPFDGDGRTRVSGPVASPTQKVVGQPMSVTNAQARNLIAHFNATGMSAHSGWGSTVWVLIAWAAVNKIAITVTMHIEADGQMGAYTVTRV